MRLFSKMAAPIAATVLSGHALAQDQEPVTIDAPEAAAEQEGGNFLSTIHFYIREHVEVLGDNGFSYSYNPLPELILLGDFDHTPFTRLHSCNGLMSFNVEPDGNQDMYELDNRGVLLHAASLECPSEQIENLTVTAGLLDSQGGFAWIAEHAFPNGVVPALSFESEDIVAMEIPNLAGVRLDYLLPTNEAREESLTFTGVFGRTVSGEGISNNWFNDNDAFFVSRFGDLGQDFTIVAQAKVNGALNDFVTDYAYAAELSHLSASGTAEAGETRAAVFASAELQWTDRLDTTLIGAYDYLWNRGGVAGNDDQVLTLHAEPSYDLTDTLNAHAQLTAIHRDHWRHGVGGGLSWEFRENMFLTVSALYEAHESSRPDQVYTGIGLSVFNFR